MVFFDAILLLNVNHVHEVVEGVKRRGVGDIVDKEEGIGLEVRRGPEPAVLFLAGGVSEREEVGQAIDGACDGIGIFNCGVVSRMVEASARRVDEIETPPECSREEGSKGKKKSPLLHEDTQDGTR